MAAGPAGSTRAPAPSGPRPFSLTSALDSSRTLYMERYFILGNDEVYVPLYLNSGDKAGFLHAPLAGAWRARLDLFAQRFAVIAGLARAQGTPVILLFAPQRAQAAIASLGGFPQGHADLLPAELARIAGSQGATFADGLRAIPAGTPSGTLFYAVNGHPNGRGHFYIAQALERALVAGGATFASCRPPA